MVQHNHAILAGFSRLSSSPKVADIYTIYREPPIFWQSSFHTTGMWHIHHVEYTLAQNTRCSKPSRTTHRAECKSRKMAGRRRHNLSRWHIFDGTHCTAGVACPLQWVRSPVLPDEVLQFHGADVRQSTASSTFLSTRPTSAFRTSCPLLFRTHRICSVWERRQRKGSSSSSQMHDYNEHAHRTRSTHGKGETRRATSPSIPPLSRSRFPPSWIWHVNRLRSDWKSDSESDGLGFARSREARRSRMVAKQKPMQKPNSSFRKGGRCDGVRTRSRV